MEIKIALTNLGKYNEGELHFEWLTLPFTDNEYNEALEAIGIDGEEYEEYFISDYEAPFKIEEYSNINHLNELAERLDDMTEGERDIVALIYDEHTSNWEEAFEIVEDNDYTEHHGCRDMSDVAYNYIHEYGIYDLNAMGNLSNYINYEAFGRDLDIEGTYLTLSDDIIIEVHN